MSRRLSSSVENFEEVPDVDSDVASIDELTSLGLNPENLPPEFKRSFEELSDDEKLFHNLKTKWLNEWKENDKKRKLAETEQQCEAAKKPEATLKEVQIVPSTSKDYRELLKDIKMAYMNLEETFLKLNKLKKELKSAITEVGVTELEIKKINVSLKYLHGKATRSFGKAITVTPQAVPIRSKKGVFKIKPSAEIQRNKK